MIEQGLGKLVQGNPDVAAIASTGGYLRELPKGQTLPSWTYATITNPPLSAHLQGRAGLRAWQVQIDCYGRTATEVIGLAAAIASVLDGFSGVLTDEDATRVDSAFLEDMHDPEFDSASRTWRRVVEFQVNYVSQF